MKKAIFLFLVLSAHLFTKAQNYAIGHTTINFVDSSRSNRSIPTEIYYPANTAGDNVAFTSQTISQFPLLVFGHGFLAPWDAYQNFWDVLVPKGYIMAFPKTEATTSTSHLEYAKDFSFLINQMNTLGATTTSMFYNKVSPMNSVMGHSMGGGSSFLAIPLNSNITTLVNFAPTETTPSAIAITPSITIPTLIIGGTLDCITPPATNQLPLYNGLASNCKTYINIVGATHCQMANANLLCSSGETFCTPATISRSTQHTLIFKYLVPWLDFQLKGICSQGNLFDNQIATDSAILYLKNCIQCNPLMTQNFESDTSVIRTFPNPANDKITFKGKKETTYSLKILNILSKIVFEMSFDESTTINLSKFQAGTYFYEIIDKNGNQLNGKFIKI